MCRSLKLSGPNCETAQESVWKWTNIARKWTESNRIYRVFHLRMCFLKGLKMSENQYVDKKILHFLVILVLLLLNILGCDCHPL